MQRQRDAPLNSLKAVHDGGGEGGGIGIISICHIRIIIGLFSKKMDGACKNYCFASFMLLPKASGEWYFSGKCIYSEFHFDLIERWLLPWLCERRISLPVLTFSLQTPEAPALSLLAFSSYQGNLLKINFPSVPSFQSGCFSVPVKGSILIKL